MARGLPVDFPRLEVSRGSRVWQSRHMLAKRYQLRGTPREHHEVVNRPKPRSEADENNLLPRQMAPISVYRKIRSEAWNAVLGLE